MYASIGAQKLLEKNWNRFEKLPLDGVRERVSITRHACEHMRVLQK